MVGVKNGAGACEGSLIGVQGVGKAIWKESEALGGVVLIPAGYVDGRCCMVNVNFDSSI